MEIFSLRSINQLPAKVSGEGEKIYGFDGYFYRVASVITASAGCLSDKNPVCRPVAGSRKTIQIHERFQ
jgi:hypothetical protein